MNEKQVQDQLIILLGKNSFNNWFKVDPDFGKLCKAVNYLASQMVMSGVMTDYKDRNDYIGEILENTVKILNE
jgi:hypothetical protein